MMPKELAMDCSPLDFGLRFYSIADMPAILDIESDISKFPWTTGDFVQATEAGTYAHMRVAVRDNIVIGYSVFEVYPGSVEIIKFAVAKEFRRRGVGTAILEDIKKRMYPGDELVFYIRESNLPAQLFLRKHKLVATLERSFFADHSVDDFDYDCDADDFLMQYEDGYRFSFFQEANIPGLQHPYLPL